MFGIGARYGALLGLAFVVIAFATAHRYWEFPEAAQNLQYAQRVLLACRAACSRVGVIPAVAMRQFMPAIGAAITHRAIARNNQMAGAIAGPGAGVRMHASAGASFARFR